MSLSKSNRASLISMIRPDMVVMSFFHESKSSGLVRIMETWEGRCANSTSATKRNPRKVVVFAPATHDMSSVSGRVRDLASLQDGQLGLDPLGLLGIGRDDVQSTDSFVVQPGVLGKRLRGACNRSRSAGMPRMRERPMGSQGLTWQTNIGTLFSANFLIDPASRSRSPVANPW